MELDGALGNVQLAGDLLVGEIFKEGIEDFLLAAAEIGDGVGAEAAALAREDRVHESRKQRAGHPEAAIGHKREGAGELFAGFDVGEQTLDAEAKERIAAGFGVFIGDNDEAGLWIAFEDIGDERAGGLLGGMTIDDVYLGARRVEMAKIGSKSGFQLPGNDMKRRARKGAFKLAQNQRVGRQEANG